MFVFVKPGNSLDSLTTNLDGPKQMLIVDIDGNNNINVTKTQFTEEITLNNLGSTKLNL